MNLLLSMRPALKNWMRWPVVETAQVIGVPLSSQWLPGAKWQRQTQGQWQASASTMFSEWPQFLANANGVDQRRNIA